MSDCAPRTEEARRRRAQLGTLRDALEVVVGLSLSSLPTGARVLCVGAGTGEEIVALAARHRDFDFVAVDPDEVALETARARLISLGHADRCRFHVGPIHSLAEGAFDGATSLLVSHWMDREARAAYFAAIYDRLRAGAVFVNADLAFDEGAASSAAMMRVWLDTLRHHDLPADRFEDMAARMSLWPESEVAQLIRSVGFEQPALVYRSILLHGWLTHKPNAQRS